MNMCVNLPIKAFAVVDFLKNVQNCTIKKIHRRKQRQDSLRYENKYLTYNK